MAYDPTKKKNPIDGHGYGDDESAYAGLTGQSVGPMDVNAAGTYSSVGPEQASMPGNDMAGGGNEGDSATGYVNFDRIYNANANTAQNSASNLGNKVGGEATGATNDLAKTQSAFTGAVSSGVEGGPSAAQQAWAQYGNTGVDGGKEVTSAHYGTAAGTEVRDVDANGNFVGTHADADPTTYTETGQGLESTSTRGAPGTNGAATGAYDPSQDAANQAAVNAGASHGYTGPNTLSDEANYANLTKETANAATDVNALGTPGGIQAQQGGNALDAALTGAAGRPRFAQFQQDYGGNQLQSRLDSAAASSTPYADAAKQREADAESQYGALTSEYGARQGADQQAASDSAAKSQGNITNAINQSDNKAAFDQYMNGNGGSDTVRNVVHTVGETLNPVDWIAEGTGNTMPTQSLTNDISPQGPGNPGNKSPAWQPGDENVYASMTQADWDAFSSLNEQQQKDWIAERKKKTG